MTVLCLLPKYSGKWFSDFIAVVRKVENNRPLVQLENEALALEIADFELCTFQSI